MSYAPLGVTIIQNFAAPNQGVVRALLPQIVIGPGYHIEALASSGLSYDGGAKTVPYPNKPASSWVDLGDADTWGENELPYPVEVVLRDGTKIAASDVTGYFGSADHHAVSKVAAGTQINGFPAGTFSAASVGKKIYIHTGDAGDRGERTIVSVSLDGSSITVSGGAFSASESVNASILPSNGKVSRFYASGALSSARAGDTLQLGPAWTTTYTVASVDTLGNYVNLTTTRNPSGVDTSWRIVTLFDLVQVTSTLQARQITLQKGTDYSLDKDGIYLNPGIIDAASPSGLVLSGTILVSYRAIKTGLASSTYSILNDTDAAALGVVSPYNPLALGVQKARENNVFEVLASGADVSSGVKSALADFNGPGSVDFSDVFDRISEEDVYVISLLSQYASHHAELKSHVVDVSSPDGDFNNLRIGILNAKLVTDTYITENQSFADWTVDGMTSVQAYTDAITSAKGKRLWSRGVRSFPGFNLAGSPLPVVPTTDLVKLSGSPASTTDGFHQVNTSEVLEKSGQRGYTLAYGNRIRSCTFGLTASDSGGFVRLTGPTGTFSFLASEGASPVSLGAIAYLPGDKDGVLCEISALDIVNFEHVTLNIPYDAGYAGASLSQVFVDGYDDVFASPGLGTQRHVGAVIVNMTAGANGIATAVSGTPFKDMEGLTIEIVGSAGDDGFYEIQSVGGGGASATMTSAFSGSDAGVTANRNLLRVDGASGLAEFNVASVDDAGLYRFAGRAYAVAGNKATGTNNLDSFPAGTWGPDDVGRTVRFKEAAGAWVKRTITAFVDTTEITVDGAVFADSNAISLQMIDTAPEELSVVVKEKDASDEYIILNLNWALRYAGAQSSSLYIEDVGTFGLGDARRSVRILDGNYAGQSYTVWNATESELILSSATAFGATGGLGADSTAEDLSGCSIVFIATPGTNTLSLRPRTTALIDAAGRTYEVQRDFRRLTVTGETFLTKGIQAGDYIDITAPSALAGSYLVSEVPSEEELVLDGTTPLSPAGLVAVFDGALDALEYDLRRPLSKDEQAAALAAYGTALGHRRVVMVWPDSCVINVDNVDYTVPGYHLGCIVGAFVSGLPPQQPMSRLALVGIEQVNKSMWDGYFRRQQHNVIAGGGVLILMQEKQSNPPYIYHQLTTDMSTLKFQELSVTKNVDYVSRVVKQEFTPYTGKYNITAPFISMMRSRAQSIATFFENQNDSVAGPMVNKFEFVSIDQSPTADDELEIVYDGVFPIPFNRLRVTINA